jgi:hypothetical protein
VAYNQADNSHAEINKPPANYHTGLGTSSKPHSGMTLSESDDGALMSHSV